MDGITKSLALVFERLGVELVRTESKWKWWTFREPITLYPAHVKPTPMVFLTAHMYMDNEYTYFIEMYTL
jgi:hypothetical protein